MNFRWGNVGTFQISPGSHMWQWSTNTTKKENEPVADHHDALAYRGLHAARGRGFRLRHPAMGCDEIGIAGAVQGAPIRLVKARTVDAMAWRMPRWCSKLCQFRVIAASNQGSGRCRLCRAVIIFIPIWAATWAKFVQGPPSTSRRDHAQA